MKSNAIIGKTGHYHTVRIKAIDSYEKFTAFEMFNGKLNAGLFARGPLADKITADTDVSIGDAYIPVFPDRRSADTIKEGVVRIDKLKPMISKKGMWIGYAFADGSMPIYEWPDDADIAEWLAIKAGKDKRFAAPCVEWLKTTNNGRLVRICAAEKVFFLTKGEHPDILCRELDPSNGELDSATHSFRPYIGSGALFHTARAELAANLLEHVAFGEVGLPHFEELKYSVECEGYRACQPSDKFFTDLVDEARRIHFLSQYEFAGVTYLRVTPNNGYGSEPKFWLIRNFHDEEIEELAATVSKINLAANDEFKRLIKKGRMKAVKNYDCLPYGADSANRWILIQDGQR